MNKFISDWEDRCYSSGIPDCADERLEQFGKVPSYRRIVKAIIKNDITGKSLGFGRPESVLYGEIKRDEISRRRGSQQNLFI